MIMKGISENNICLTEENLEHSGLVSSKDVNEEEDYENISMVKNVGFRIEREGENLTVKVNSEIIEKEQDLTETVEDSPEKNFDDSDEDNNPITKKKKPRVICSDDENCEENSKSGKENIQKPSKNKLPAPDLVYHKRKTKKNIMAERLKIQSNNHRFMRDVPIKIPYHMPKQRTLREFLSRKKNRANIPLNAPSFLMKEIWKDIEESTKNASEFFKSDSDSDCESSEEKIKGKKYEEKDRERESGLGTFDDTSNDKNADEIENDAECNFSNDKQENCKGNNNNNNVETLHEPLTVEQNNSEKENEGNSVSIEIHEGNTEILHDVTDKQSNSNNTCKNSNQCIDSGIPKSMQELNSDDDYAKMKTLEWVNKIPDHNKLYKPNKKENLLKRINPKLLQITPKLSGDANSVVDLENSRKDTVIGVQKLRNRFYKHCLIHKEAMREKEEGLSLIAEEHRDIFEFTKKKSVFESGKSLESMLFEKPLPKLQRLREELEKKIEKKWFAEQYEKQALEVAKPTKVAKMIEDEEEMLEYLEDIDQDESLNGETEDNNDSDEEEEEDDIYECSSRRRMVNNKCVKRQDKESLCEESGNEGGDELDEEQEQENEDEDNDKNLGLNKEILSLDYDEVFGVKEKDPVNRFHAYGTQSSEIPPYQPGGGMLNGGSKLSQYDDDYFPKNILSPALKLSMLLSPEKKNTASQQSLDSDPDLPEASGKKESFTPRSSEENKRKDSFVPRVPENENFDLNEAYEFCSGEFEDNRAASGGLMLNSPASVTSEGNDQGSNPEVFGAGNSLPLECSGSKKDEEVIQAELRTTSRLKVMSEDSEEEPEIPDANENLSEHITGKRISSDCSDNDTEKSFNLTNKKTKKHLCFSDEEESLGSELEENAPGSEDEVVEEENVEETYDSDESEVEQFEEDSTRKVEYNSEEEEIVNPREFFEREAELSGEEWSGDEDERGLDKMEEEVGDDDKLDDRKVRSQLEKIHMRTLLDDDAREVRILQEIFFEDGDLHDDGPKREKNYKWKDLGAFFDEDKNNDGDPVASQDQEEVEEDEQSTKLRHEKELFLLNLKTKTEESGSEDEVENKNTSLLKLGKVVVQRSVNSNIVHEEKVERKNSNDIDNIGYKMSIALTAKRGSFLSRNEEFLSRLAKFTSNASDNILGPKHSKNFVFAAKSPEKPNNLSKEISNPKRRGVSPESNNQRNKKAKLSEEVTHPKTSILDKLV